MAEATLFFLIGYLAIIFIIAWFFSRKENIETYFVNRRKTSLLLMVCSNVASLVGAGATVAVVSEVYNSGISYGIAFLTSIVAGGILLAVFAKHIRAYGKKHNIYTIVDFFHKRYDLKNKVLVMILQMFMLIVWIGMQAVAISSLASVLLGVNYHIAILISLGVTLFYTTVGGLKMDIISDFIHFWIIIIIFCIMFFYAYSGVHGFSGLISNLPKGHLNPFGFAGIPWLFSASLLGGLLYLGNTTDWQRILSAESETTARKSFIWATAIILVLGLVILFLGLSSAALLSGTRQDTAIFSLMDAILPKYLVAIGFVAVLAVIMSTLDSLLVGGSTIIYRAIFKTGSKNKRQMVFARMITAVFGISGFAVAFLIPNIITLSLLASYSAVIFTPAIFLGFYSKRFSADAAFFSILIPFIVLVVSFPFNRAYSFVAPSILVILITAFYDRIFKPKKR